MQDYAAAGSQRWLQIAIDRHPNLLAAPLALGLGSSAGAIEWRSPLSSDAFREYRDTAALRRLDVSELPFRELSSFWPARGPVWDALGRTAAGDLLFVEAKAHIAEAASPPSKASSDASKALIHATLNEVRAALAPNSESDWSSTFYQYANRLSHVYLLRALNKLPAHLVLVYFLNATDVRGPGTIAEWQAAIQLIKAALGLQEHLLSPFVHDIFVDVQDLVLPSSDASPADET